MAHLTQTSGLIFNTGKGLGVLSNCLADFENGVWPGCLSLIMMCWNGICMTVYQNHTSSFCSVFQDKWRRTPEKPGTATPNSTHPPKNRGPVSTVRVFGARLQRLYVVLVHVGVAQVVHLWENWHGRFFWSKLVLMVMISNIKFCRWECFESEI